MIADTAYACVALLQAAWPHHELPDETVELYAAGLKRLPIPDEDAKRAIQLFVFQAQSRYVPPVGEVLEHVIRNVAPAPPFETVWRDLCDAADQTDYFDPDKPPEILGPWGQALAARIGWARFRAANPLDPWFHRACRRLYEGIERSYVADVIAEPKLLGKPFVPSLPAGGTMLPDAEVG